MSEHQLDIPAMMPGMKGRGVRMKGLLDFPARAIEADHVVFHAEDGTYTVRLVLQQAREYGVLVQELDGNVKGVVRIEVTRGQGRETRQNTCLPPPG